MGKTQHGKDKMYVTASEQAALTGPRRVVAPPPRALPFDHCALSLTRWSNPVMTPDGSVFELTQLVPFLRKHKLNPVTGEPLGGKDVVKLHWHRNAAGALACPVTGRVFTEHSRILALRTTGNVYSSEAVNELCAATKSWRDLLTDAPAERADFLVIADPTNPVWVAAHASDSFFHVREAAKGSGSSGSSGPSVRLDESSRRVLAEVAAKEAAAAAAAGGGGAPSAATGGAAWRAALGFTPAATVAAASAAATAAPHVSGYGVATSGAYSGSLTSTSLTPVTRNVAAPVTEAQRRASRQRGVAGLKKKAYVRLTTTHGELNVELHADLTPATVDSFLTLAKRGYYDGTTFHRLIRGFMIQGGDPTGTGTGGECAWGGRFADEFHPRLSHDARGVLSMANAGSGTNGSQFFITFRPTPHLDHKHTVFGRVVGGLDTTLRALEAVETDAANDRPKERVAIESVTVFADPFAEWDAAEAAKEGEGRGGGGGAGGVAGSVIVGSGASLAARTASGTAPVVAGGRVVPAAQAAAAAVAAAAAASNTWLADPAPRLSDVAAGAGEGEEEGATFLPRPRGAASGGGGLVLPPPSDGSSSLLAGGASRAPSDSASVAAAPPVGALLRAKLGGGGGGGLGLGLGVYGASSGASAAAAAAAAALSPETLAAMGVTPAEAAAASAAGAGAGADGDGAAAPPPAKRPRLGGGAGFGNFSGW